MLAGFLLIALALSGAALRSWLVLEEFVVHSRQAGEQALRVNASLQELAERTVELERSARQFMVLEDGALLERFDANAARALAAVSHLESLPGETLGPAPVRWREALQELRGALHRAPSPAELLPFLNRLSELNRSMEASGISWIDKERAAMMSELEESRADLARLVIGAVVGALLVALAMGWWLSRPIRSLERSIERLGESRFDAKIEVGGPTDLRQVGRRLDWLRRRLDELESDRERTLRHVSHELKTPLTALREGIALLQDEVVGALKGSQREVVDILQHNVMALQRHIESLLRLNAAALEARRLRYRPLPLDKLLADVVHGRELQIQARQLTVERQSPAVTRQLDGEKLLVALDNLLSNAIEFSPLGGLIRLHAEATDDRVRIACRDQGPGIAAEDAERIFEPFVQGGRASPTPRQGSGVGLSIVRELMTAMGGRVLLLPRDADAPGANFVLEVPCEQAV